jgi:cation:H+ antiporter
VFQTFSIWINLAIFAAGAAVIWFAGTRLERYTDALSRRTGLGKAFLGFLLLATATSLPEIATTVTATLGGNVDLAIHNLLGGVVAQTVILALADLKMGRRPLTRFTPQYVLLIEGVGLVLLLSVALVTMILDGTWEGALTVNLGALTISLTPLALLASFLAVMFLTHRSQGYPRWHPIELEPDVEEAARAEEEGEGDARTSKSLRQIVLFLALAGLAVLAAGWVTATVAEVLAEQTGLGSSVVGFLLLSIATSLPELSTTFSAVDEGNYSVVVSNVFGSNAFDVTLLSIVALLYTGHGSVFQTIPVSAVFAAALGIVMTCLYLWGLLEREDRTFLRMGWDSSINIVLYIAGSIALYLLR